MIPSTLSTIQKSSQPSEFRRWLVDACTNETKKSHSMACILWLLCSGHVSTRQAFEKFTYLELCPAYVATVQGSSRWSAAEAWQELKQIIQWSEVSGKQARQLGAKLRSTAKRRRGRHLVVFHEKMKELKAAFVSVQRKRPELAKTTAFSGQGYSDPLYSVKCRKTANLKGNFSEKSNCPMVHNHKHGDRNPSLVLWRNSDQVSGGAMCMTCGEKFRVKFRPEGVADLFMPNGKKSPSDRCFAPDLHNIRPYRSKEPFQDRFKTDVKGVLNVHTASLKTSENGSFRTTPYRSRRDLFEALISADRKAASQKTAEAMKEKFFFASGSGFQRHEIPDRIVSVSDLKVSQWTETKNGAFPSKFAPYRQRFVLFDLDGFGSFDEKTALKAFKACQAKIAGAVELSGRFAFVQTSDRGVQIYAELSEARRNPLEWFRLCQVRSWYSSVASELLKACKGSGLKGGQVDLSSCAAGRFGRLPSWRVTKQGQLFRAKLIGLKN